MADKLSVLVIDEQPIVRWALNYLFKTRGDISVLAESNSVIEAARPTTYKPDVVIIDPDYLDTVQSAVAIELMQSQQWRALAYSAQDSWNHVEAFLKSGGLGFVSKRSPINEVIPALYAVAQGKQWISPSLRSTAAFGSADNHEEKTDILTPREYEIARLIAKGLTSKQIADQLCISLKTVEAHRYRVFRKLNIQRSAQLVEFILKESLPDSIF